MMSWWAVHDQGLALMALEFRKRSPRVDDTRLGMATRCVSCLRRVGGSSNPFAHAVAPRGPLGAWLVPDGREDTDKENRPIGTLPVL